LNLTTSAQTSRNEVDGYSSGLSFLPDAIHGKGDISMTKRRV